MAQKDRISIKITADMVEGVMRLSYLPKHPAPGDMQATDEFLRVLLGGFKQALSTLLLNVPVLRPASDLEKEHHVYVYKDGVHDNNLAKVRTQLYRNIQSIINDVLKTYFSDIVYIEEVTEYQQNKVFDMSDKDLEDHRIEIEEITRQVKEMEDNEEIINHDDASV